MSTDPAITAHQTWLGYIQPVGLVVSAPALVAAQCALPLDAAARQATLQSLAPDGRIGDLVRLLETLLDWQPTDLVAADALTDLHLPLPEYGDILAPTWAVPKPDGEPGWQMLVVVSADDPLPVAEVTQKKIPHVFDRMPSESASGWRATPQSRIERLLREREVPIGLLCNATDLRLVYRPTGESSGHLTFRVPDMLEVPGRPILGALYMLLSAERLFTVPPNKRLPAVLKESRKYQSQVSNALAEQVLGALDDLLRGFEMADADRGGNLLRHAVDTDPQHVYGGLITVLLRLVFLLYAEERGLMSGDPVYVRHYAIAGLFEKLREDAGRHPDTMDQRYGAWARLLSLFRFVWQGGGDEHLHLPGRRGSLFDPGIYAFLEGRAYRQTDDDEKIAVPRVPDGVVWRVLEKLLLLDGERLSYRALDVEQIGSVYEAMMGFELRRAYAPSVAVRSKTKNKGARKPRVVVSLRTVRDLKPSERAKYLVDFAGCALGTKPAEALKTAKTEDDIAIALHDYVPEGRVLPTGSLYLQPGDERRKSGSHYTPRTLTEPIVRTTLRPVLEALGERPRPEQILDLKVCDPAMGSGAFLVEACRQLADALIEAWSVHQCTPEIPADEDPLLFAQRLVAQKCLYGVDKNPYAVNLAKLSLWLVTLAKDHPFTFLDHALKHGDSLVGLTKRQIGRFDWSPDDAETPALMAAIEAATANARGHRDDIHRAGDDDDARKRLAWREAENDLDPARVMGDLCVAAFFGAEDPKRRGSKRGELRALVGRWRAGDAAAGVDVEHTRTVLWAGDRPVVPLHWEIEFPEVFDRPNGGFDAIVGNPPFAGKNTIAAANADGFTDWLKVLHDGSHGNADLVAHFFRRAFGLLRTGGTFGLIATNTIAQGDTRASGLRWIRQHRGCIYDATRRLKWPGLAAVVVSVVHVARGVEVRPVRLEGKPVERITAFLFPTGPDDDPATLTANANTSYTGIYILGQGFTFDDTDAAATPIGVMHQLVQEDPANLEAIQPYIGGEELVEHPTHQTSRFVINFRELTAEEAASRWPILYALVEAKVRPQREALRDTPDGIRLKARWWQFGRTRPELQRATAGLTHVFATSSVASHLAFVRIPAISVLSHNITVFAVDNWGFLAVLQSRLHDVWVRAFASTLEDRLGYRPSDCFETFPFPAHWATSERLKQAASRYDGARAALMLAHDQGLTATYNRFHDPDERDPSILRLRELHADMDRAVLDAYGWTDLHPTCEFLLDWEEPEDEDADDTGKKSRRKKPWRYRWPDAVRDEVLARLLALNQQRAEEERKLAAPKGGKAVAPRKSKKPPPAHVGRRTQREQVEPLLFNDEDESS
jgi:hypothetical protein